MDFYDPCSEGSFFDVLRLQIWQMQEDIERAAEVILQMKQNIKKAAEVTVQMQEDI